MIERRRDSRFGEPVIARVRALLRPGRPVMLVNLSAGGALIESQRPLRPGSNVHLQLVLDDRSLGLAARVLRCAVGAIAAAGVRYRGAVAFEARCEGLWESGTHHGYQMPTRDLPEIQEYGQDLPDVRRSSPIAVRGVER
jgi:hypothetical protein